MNVLLQTKSKWQHADLFCLTIILCNMISFVTNASQLQCLDWLQKSQEQCCHQLRETSLRHTLILSDNLNFQLSYFSLGCGLFKILQLSSMSWNLKIQIIFCLTGFFRLVISIYNGLLCLIIAQGIRFNCLCWKWVSCQWLVISR